MSERGFDYSKAAADFLDQRIHGRRPVPVLRFRELPEEQLEAVFSDYSTISVPMLERILDSPNNELMVMDIEVYRKLNSLAKKLNVIDETDNLEPVICVMKQAYYVLYTKPDGHDRSTSKGFHFGQALGSALVLTDVPQFEFRRELQ